LARRVTAPDGRPGRAPASGRCRRRTAPARTGRSRTGWFGRPTWLTLLTRSGLPFHDKKTTVVVPGTRELGDAPSPFRQAEHQTVPRQVVDPPVRPASARGAQVDALGPPLGVEPKAPAVLCLALDLRLPMVPFEEEYRPQLLRAGDPLAC